MLHVEKLYVCKHHGLWFLADNQGFICCADNSGILYDCLNYCKIHKVRSIDDIKERFSNILFFLR